ncbi:MAG TPA: RNA methyltransferase, partial [Candidatus Lustribacter sp.]|nr:RNA methyltransferase [Candidatus Lustribacter sp.]
VLVSDASVDVYNPRVVRASAGSVFHVPIVTGLPVETILGEMRHAGLRLFAADGAAAESLDDADLTSAHAWVMGNEAWGLPESTRDACDAVVRVPIYGQAESLNLAMATTICLYASARQQRTHR